MANILRKVIENDKGELRKLEKIAKKVESYADQMASLSDRDLQGKTLEFKERYQKGETLEQLLPEAFAVVREAAKRVLGLFPYRVQIMGGIVLHNGDVPEMRTGEGKPLQPPCQFISMLLLVRVFTLLLLMSIFQRVTLPKWVKCIAG